MTKYRYDRIGEEIKKEVADILMHDIKDPNIGFVSIVLVEVTSDLQQAKVYYSVMGSDEEIKGTQQAIKRSAGFIRREIAHRLSLRHTPELLFIYDTSIEHGIKIAKILEDDKKLHGDYSRDEEVTNEE